MLLLCIIWIWQAESWKLSWNILILSIKIKCSCNKAVNWKCMYSLCLSTCVYPHCAAPGTLVSSDTKWGGAILLVWQTKNVDVVFTKNSTPNFVLDCLHVWRLYFAKVLCWRNSNPSILQLVPCWMDGSNIIALNKQTVPVEKKVLLASTMQMGKLLSFDISWLIIIEVLWELNQLLPHKRHKWTGRKVLAFVLHIDQEANPS